MSIEDAGHFMINHKIEKRRIRKILIFLHILTRRKGRSKTGFTFYFFTEKRLHEQKFGFQRELGGRKAIKAYYFILSINYIYILLCAVFYFVQSVIYQHFTRSVNIFWLTFCVLFLTFCVLFLA